MSSADARGSGANEKICTLVMKTCQMRILTAEKCEKTDTVLVESAVIFGIGAGQIARFSTKIEEEGENVK